MLTLLVARPIGAQNLSPTWQAYRTAQPSTWSYRYVHENASAGDWVSFAPPTQIVVQLNVADEGYSDGNNAASRELHRKRLANWLTRTELNAWVTIPKTDELTTPLLQSYPGLFFLPLASPLTDDQLGKLDGLDLDPDVAWVAPAFSFFETIVVPRSTIFVGLERTNDSRRWVLPEGYRVEERWEGVHGATLLLSHLDAPHTSFERARALLDSPGVRFAHPNFMYRSPSHQSPNDPLFPQQWPHENTGQYSGSPGSDLESLVGWSLTTGSADVRIAILDTGVDLDHPELVDALDPGYDATDQPSPGGIPGQSLDIHPHGTACAGLAVARGNNGIGLAGIAWSCRLVPVRVRYGSVTQGDWIVDAFHWCTDSGVDILSNSWGSSPPTDAERDAVAYATSIGRDGLGAIVLCSAGNTGPITAPALYAQSIAVGATSQCDERKSSTSCDGELGWQSAFGPALDLVAPGVECTTTDSLGPLGYSAGDFHQSFSGTSAACPLVAGAVGLLLSLEPELTRDDVYGLLINGTEDQVGPTLEDTVGFDEYMGFGRLNLGILLGQTVDLLPPQAVTCSASSGRVSLSWENADAYSAVVVSRNGADVAVLPATAESYVDSHPSAGLMTYRVRGVTGSGVSPAVSCTLFVQGLTSDLIWSPAESSGATESGLALADGLLSLGRQALLVEALPSLSVLTQYDMIWVCLGTYPNHHVLSAEDGLALANYLDTDPSKSLYMEGGDTWAADPETAVHPYFGIVGVDDGDADLSVIQGSDAPSCELGRFAFPYMGENERIDRLEAGADANAVLSNDLPEYSVGVFRESGGRRTFGGSFEFGGLAPAFFTRAELLEVLTTALTGATGINSISTGNLVGLPGDTVEQNITASTQFSSFEAASYVVSYDPNLLEVQYVTTVGTTLEGSAFVQVDQGDPSVGEPAVWTMAAVFSFIPPFGFLPPSPQFSIGRCYYTVRATAETGDIGNLEILPEGGSTGVDTLLVGDGGTSAVPARRGGTIRIAHPLEGSIAVESAAGAPGEFVDIWVRGSFDADVAGYSFGVEFAESDLRALAISLQGTVGEDADFFSANFDNSPDEGWFTASVLIDVSVPAQAWISAGDDLPLGRVTFAVWETAVPGRITSLTPTESLGNPEVATSLLGVDGFTVVPTFTAGTFTVEGGLTFIRGDANSNSAVELGDAIRVLEYIVGEASLNCLDAADANDSGGVDIADSVTILLFLFVSGPPPPPPYPTFGLDPTLDSMGCAEN